MCLDELVDNVHLMIQTNTEGKITFEGNAGVYMVRGALYLNNANISDKTCKMKVNFINNTAIKSGNLVYFATTRQGVVPNCSYNDIQLNLKIQLTLKIRHKTYNNTSSTY